MCIEVTPGMSQNIMEEVARKLINQLSGVPFELTNEYDLVRKLEKCQCRNITTLQYDWLIDIRDKYLDKI